ncbi:hypothetical protein GXY_09864 [Novacetimonas hansenii ATCC 23769]|uniref:Uncharacterized protein n=1 Tax=Novacetimonas hansenii ATCC 23769 TaxID=714995 RepID=D5QFQ3_NOVHA|nr:hypothetical protein GXY_09864 [Novacetimonas hansenii ATCC 23769]
MAVGRSDFMGEAMSEMFRTFSSCRGVNINNMTVQDHCMIRYGTASWL